jgi:hypothetical protein
MMQFPAAPVASSIIGWLIALLVLVVVVVLAIIGQMDTREALLLGGLALARLL